MSGMDRLTDGQLDRARRALDYYEDCANQLSKGGSGSEGAYDSLEYDGGKLARDVMAEIDATMRELLALRRASQATPTGTELQPCPFCGGEADTMTPEADDMRAATVMCMGCYCTGKECETKAQAIAAWNRRASQAAPATQCCEKCNGRSFAKVDGSDAYRCVECKDVVNAPAPSDGLREAVDAAWNDAIEAAAQWHQSEIARLKEQVSENNAYQARVGAASYDSDANRYCIDQISAHQQSVAAIHALRRAAPTEGEA